MTMQKPQKLVTQSLVDALKAMSVGQTCEAPMGISRITVKVRACELKAEGYNFATFVRDDIQYVTRLK